MSQYESLGASASKAGLHSALKQAGLSESDRYFAQIFPDLAGDPSYRSFVHCDGAGTKSVVAYLMYRETGDPKWFRGLAQDALVMNLDDCFSVGPIEGLMLANAIARNSRLVPDEALREIFAGYRDCVETLEKVGISIQLSGGETADTADVVRTILVDAVLCGRIKTEAAIDNSCISPGDVIVAISSAGRATYENVLNSGIASNGLTLARHALLSSSYQDRYPETTQPEYAQRGRAIGGYKLTDKPEGLGMTIGEALLSPTRTFAPLLLRAYETLPGRIHGVIHNTGGGMTKVLRFGRGNRYRKSVVLPIPKIFNLIQESGRVKDEEMLRVFNMGQRLEFYVAPSDAPILLELASQFALDAAVIGEVEPLGDDSRNEVIVKLGANEYTYSHQF